MKKSILVCFVCVLAMVFLSSASFAQPSAKATAQLGNLAVIDLSNPSLGDYLDEGWAPIFTQVIKTPTGKSLFMDVSLECGLTTNTKVMSKLLQRATADAEAIVKVQVLIDGDPVAVNENGDSEIIFARRQQTLIAEFAGLYDLTCIETTYWCKVWNEDHYEYTKIDDPLTAVCDGDIITTVSISDDEECYTEESLQLILSTMQANSFNFVSDVLEAGEHTVTVQAKLEYDADYVVLPVEEPAGSYSAANAYLGNGCVTIETVRMIKDEDVVVDLD